MKQVKHGDQAFLSKPLLSLVRITLFAGLYVDVKHSVYQFDFNQNLSRRTAKDPKTSSMFFFSRGSASGIEKTYKDSPWVTVKIPQSSNQLVLVQTTLHPNPTHLKHVLQAGLLHYCLYGHPRRC